MNYPDAGTRLWAVVFTPPQCPTCRRRIDAALSVGVEAAGGFEVLPCRHHVTRLRCVVRPREAPAGQRPAGGHSATQPRLPG